MQGLSCMCHHQSVRRICRVILVCTLLKAQTHTAPQFEAASVKAATSSGMARGVVGGPGSSSPNLIAYNQQSLTNLVFMAYQVQFYQLATPSWMDGEYFDIHARIPAGTTHEDVRLMPRDLLVVRFNLKIHHETRQIQGYALTLGKSGIKMSPSPPPQAATPP
jgi:uncharacterized protein (TIGR03435 family)